MSDAQQTAEQQPTPEQLVQSLASCAMDNMSKLGDEIRRLRTEVAKRDEFIERYAVHDSNCANVHPDRCSCGFYKMQDQFDGAMP